MNFLVINFNLIVTLLLAMSSGALIRISLTMVNQRWASTYHHTMSYIMLPMITFVITKVITGNIALSLGMIGALSIVRFRNPVKNPFELVLFFALITIGISMSVNVVYGLLLTAGVVGSILLVHFLEKAALKLNWSIFSMSFDEGQMHNILEVTSASRLEELDTNDLLVQKAFSKEHSEFFYRLMATDKNKLNDIYLKITAKDAISSIDFKIV